MVRSSSKISLGASTTVEPIIDAAYNAYRLTMVVSNCGTSNGSYQGVAILADLNTTGDEDMLVVQMNSNALIFTTFLTRL